MTPDSISVMIFAAGRGTRMGDLTKTTPKPMLPLHGRPMIDHTLDIVAKAGITKPVANTHHLAEKITPHLENAGVFVCQEHGTLLDTGGGLRNALPHLTSPTLTINPDVIWSGPNPLTFLLNAWADDMQSLLLVVPKARAINRTLPGDFHLDGSELKRGGDLVYTGAQILRTNRLSEIKDTVFSLNTYWDLLASSGDLHGLIYPGTWTDIGTDEALAQANAQGASHV